MRATEFLFPLLLLAAAPLAAHETITTRLTWSQEISRIFQSRCMSCHRDGGAAPMPLTAYEEARPWAKAIRDEVLSRRMPQWGAAKGFGDFSPDGALSQEEIMRIAEWVEGGAPNGDERYLPPPAAFDAPKRAKAPAGVDVSKELRLSKPLHLGALYPLESVEFAELTAELPDGRVLPLIALREYKAAWRRTFHLRDPLRLPAGTYLRVRPSAWIRLAPIRGAAPAR